jgi:ferric-dicitrate binding protein FerR (iron transport regulator)
MEHPFEPGFRQSALILRFLNGELTNGEEKELNDWISADPANKRLFEELTSTEHIQEELVIMDQFPVSEARAGFIEKLDQIRRPPARLFQLKWWQISAAASIIVFFLLAAWLWRPDQQNSVPVAPSDMEKAALIGPGTDKAILTLSDGNTIELGDSANGLISRQQQVDLLASYGEVRYQAQDKPAELQYNTLSTPKGGQFRLVLEDGTKVWLNAASSLTFPVAFIGEERKVILKGEGYFEVSPDAQKPFRVVMDKGVVEAIGTAFNLHTYSNETIHRATLLEGKVLVSSGDAKRILTPDQQARISDEGAIALETGVEVSAEVAWKNGQFVFRSVTIGQIMKQLERWYDIEVRYNQLPSGDRYSGMVSRSGSLAEVLRILAEGGARFRVENRQIIVF